jgi:hypothetical protein
MVGRTNRVMEEDMLGEELKFKSFGSFHFIINFGLTHLLMGT